MSEFKKYHPIVNFVLCICNRFQLLFHAPCMPMYFTCKRFYIFRDAEGQKGNKNKLNIYASYATYNGTYKPCF